jgi:hypothetical protein
LFAFFLLEELILLLLFLSRFELIFERMRVQYFYVPSRSNLKNHLMLQLMKNDQMQQGYNVTIHQLTPVQFDEKRTQAARAGVLVSEYDYQQENMYLTITPVDVSDLVCPVTRTRPKWASETIRLPCSTNLPFSGKYATHLWPKF